jgi:hypothetical protein
MSRFNRHRDALETLQSELTSSGVCSEVKMVKPRSCVACGHEGGVERFLSVECRGRRCALSAGRRRGRPCILLVEDGRFVGTCETPEDAAAAVLREEGGALVGVEAPPTCADDSA